MEKSILERHADEVLTDNTKIEYCAQCKECVHWGNSDAFSNSYNKSNCDMFPLPGLKPLFVINDTGRCKWRLEGRG